MGLVEVNRFIRKHFVHLISVIALGGVSHSVGLSRSGAARAIGSSDGQARTPPACPCSLMMLSARHSVRDRRVFRGGHRATQDRCSFVSRQFLRDYPARQLLAARNSCAFPLLRPSSRASPFQIGLGPGDPHARRCTATIWVLRHQGRHRALGEPGGHQPCRWGRLTAPRLPLLYEAGLTAQTRSPSRRLVMLRQLMIGRFCFPLIVGNQP